MTRQIFIYNLLLVLFCSCGIESDLIIHFDKQEKTVIINSILSNEKGLVAIVTTSKSPDSTSSITFKKDIVVELVTNATQRDTLIQEKDSMYVLKKITPNIQDFYQLIVHDTVLDISTYSTVIQYPNNAVQIRFDTVGYKMKDFIELEVSNIDKAQKYLMYFIEMDSLGKKITEEKTINNYQIFDFERSKSDVKYLILKPSPETREIVAKVIVLNSTLYYYLNSLRLQNSSFDEAFLEPTSVKGNIINGVGFFGSYQLVEKRVKI